MAGTPTSKCDCARHATVPPAKTMGIERKTVERLAKSAYGTEEKWISEACLIENGIDPQDRKVIHWLTFADTIQGSSLRSSTGSSHTYLSACWGGCQLNPRSRIAELLPHRWQPGVSI